VGAEIVDALARKRRCGGPRAARADTFATTEPDFILRAAASRRSRSGLPDELLRGVHDAHRYEKGYE